MVYCFRLFRRYGRDRENDMRAGRAERFNNPPLMQNFILQFITWPRPRWWWNMHYRSSALLLLLRRRWLGTNLCIFIFIFVSFPLYFPAKMFTLIITVGVLRSGDKMLNSHYNFSFRVVHRRLLCYLYLPGVGPLADSSYTPHNYQMFLRRSTVLIPVLTNIRYRQKSGCAYKSLAVELPSLCSNGNF